MENGEWIIDKDFVAHFLMLVGILKPFINKVYELFSNF